MKIREILLLVFSVLLIHCNRGPSEPEMPLVEYSEVAFLPEEKSHPLTIEKQGDSLIFYYNHPTEIPDFKLEQVILGLEGGGYIRRVKNIVKQGNTVILITENATLTDAVKYCEVKQRSRLKPTPEIIQKLNIMLQPLDTTFNVYDSTSKFYRKFHLTSDEPYFRTATEDGYDWEWVWPNVQITEQQYGWLKFEATISEIVIAFNVDVTVELHIEQFTVKRFETAFQFDQKLSIGDFLPSLTLVVPQEVIDESLRYVFYETSTDFLLGTVTIPTPPILITFRMGFMVDAGFNSITMNADWQIASGMFVKEGFMVGVVYEDGVGWYPISDTEFDGGFTPRFKGFDGEFVIDFDLLRMTMDIKMLAYDLTGPGFAIYVGGYGNLEIFRRIFEFGGFIGYDIKAYLSVFGIPIAEETIAGEQIRYPLTSISWCNLPL